jgi:hypothetical protein
MSLGKPGEMPEWVAEAAGIELANSVWTFEYAAAVFLGCPREAAEPLSVEIHKSRETFEFREPYRIDGVQSLGENGPFGE